MNLKEVRCTKCNGLLAKAAYGELEIKCAKCNTIKRVKLVLQSQFDSTRKQ